MKNEAINGNAAQQVDTIKRVKEVWKERMCNIHLVHKIYAIEDFGWRQITHAHNNVCHIYEILYHFYTSIQVKCFCFCFYFDFCLSFILGKNMPFKQQSLCIWMIETSVCATERVRFGWVNNEYVWCLALKKCNKKATTQRKKLVKPTTQHWYHCYIWIKCGCAGVFVLVDATCVCVVIHTRARAYIVHIKNKMNRVSSPILGNFIAGFKYCSPPTIQNIIYCLPSFVIYAAHRVAAKPHS